MIALFATASKEVDNMFVWLVADGWCWFVLREKYCWLIAGSWFVVRENYCWLVADKPSERGAGFRPGLMRCMHSIYAGSNCLNLGSGDVALHACIIKS
jgi:hypothetical protein